jgi:Na+/H+ antiporter NhaD/arsenite permease-like protein
MTEDQLQWILATALVELALIACYLLWRRVDAQRRLGRRLESSAPRQVVLRAVLCLAWLSAAAFWLPVFGESAADPSLRPLAFAVLVGSAIVMLLSPPIGRRSLGSVGVQSGWTCARFSEVVEWRLSGEYLRFRLEGRLWDAVGASAGRHAELRAQLERVVPARESRYTE